MDQQTATRLESMAHWNGVVALGIVAVSMIYLHSA